MQSSRGRAARPRSATHLRKTLGLRKIDIAALREASPEGLPQEPQALAARVKAATSRLQESPDSSAQSPPPAGIAFDALDDDLMLKDRPGSCVAGEMLDFDAPTGGYLLQAAFSTGVAAGRGAARFLGLKL